jgi:flagellar protein FliS
MSYVEAVPPVAADPLSRYKRTEIETAPPLKLLLMLYDGAVARSESAAECIRRGDYEAAHRSLIKAQDILTELMVSLDPDAGAAPIRELFGLYEYMHRLLVQANIRKETSPVEEVVRILTDLRDAWARAGSGNPDDEDAPPPPPTRSSLDIQS